jgi:hypothetical protein
VILVAVAALVTEFLLDYRVAAQRSRFSLFFLALWTTVIAVVLGVAASWARAAGWKLADVVLSQYFWQLQAVGVINASLALSVLLVSRLSVPASMRIVVSLGIVAVVVGLSILALFAVFGGNVGASVADMAWLFGSEGLLLVATVLPLELVAAKPVAPKPATLSP